MAVRHQGKLKAYAQTEEDGQEERTGKGGRGAEAKAGEEGSKEKKRATSRTAETKAEWRRQDKDADRVR